MQSTPYFMMVRPFSFRSNEETASSNHFQQSTRHRSQEVTARAQAEFDAFAERLRSHGLKLAIFQDDAYPDTPDAVFPNNWVSFHEDGRVALYPMMAANRRGERREEMLDILADDFGFDITEVEDFTEFENEGLFLEGTGSMVLDRLNRVAYAALGPRTDALVLETFCERFNYDTVAFKAVQEVNGVPMPVYHTNVVMSIGTHFAIVCLSAIPDTRERNGVKDALKASGRKIIDISEAQMAAFAGNAIEARTLNGELLCVMSTCAYQALRPDQHEAIGKHARLVYSDLSTIETHGGGSARCMLAEIFIPKKK
jgi:hypothetical protein